MKKTMSLRSNKVPQSGFLLRSNKVPQSGFLLRSNKVAQSGFLLRGPAAGHPKGRTKRRGNLGQALVALLVFTVVTITLATAAIIIVLVNSTRAQTVEQGTITRTLAENGIENALIRLLRDPSYAGETLTGAEGDAIVEVVAGGGNTKTITSSARSRGFVRKIEVVVDTTNYELNIQSWKQTY